MADVDTSIYNNIQNPLTQANNAVALQGGMQDIALKGIQMHAQQSVGNALLRNTGPDGNVNTDGMMAEIAGSGNPYAQQQGAELAQKLKLQQSINTQQSVAADQSAYKQMSNEMLGLQQSGDFSDKNIASFTARHYGEAMMDDNYLNGKGSKANVMEVHNYLTSLPESQRPAAVANLARTWALKGGDINSVLPSVPTMAPSGAPATQSPMATVQKQAPAPTGGVAGTMAPPGGGTAPMGGGQMISNKGLSNSDADQLNGLVTNATATQAIPTPGKAATPPPAANPEAELNITGLTPEEQARRGLQTTTNVNNSNAITTDLNSAKLSMNAAKAAKQIFSQNPNASGLVTSVLMHSPMGAQLMSDKTLSDAQRGQKLLQQVANASGVAGGGLTNAGQEVVNAANPSITNVNKAIEENLDRIIGMQQRTVAKGNMWRNYTAQNGLANATANQAQFEQNFANVADPQIFQVMNMDKSDRVKYLNGLAPDEHAKFVSQYNALKQQGAFDEQP